MKTYQLELTAEQLKVVSHAMMVYEQAMVQSPKLADYYGDNKDFGDTFLKISDQLQQYYEDNGIED